MVSTLCRSYRHAVDMLDHAGTYYHNLTNEAGRTMVEKWSEEIEAAEVKRKYDKTAMDIYAAKLAEPLESSRHPASGMPTTTLASWMELSLAVEEKQ